MGAGRMMKWERGKWKVSHNRLIERKKERKRTKNSRIRRMEYVKMNWAWLSAGESEKGAQRTRNAADGASARQGGWERNR